jgi:hypothetical protein
MIDGVEIQMLTGRTAKYVEAMIREGDPDGFAGFNRKMHGSNR